LIRVRVISDKIILPEFLWCYMTTPRYWGQINASKGGRLKQGINILALQNLLLPLPSLPEQRAIAEVLQSVDRKIEAEEARQRALEALFRTLLHDLMTARLRLPPAFIARFAEDAP
jgi:type I restriction enzyme S subunit